MIPALRFPVGTLTSNDKLGPKYERLAGLIPTPEVDGVLATARRLALKRGEPVRFRVAADGVWAVVALNGGAAIQNGRITQPLSWQPDLELTPPELACCRRASSLARTLLRGIHWRVAGVRRFDDTDGIGRCVGHPRARRGRMSGTHAGRIESRVR